MSMSKKDYEMVASVTVEYKGFLMTSLKPRESEKALVVVDGLLGALIEKFEENNPRFDRERFIEAVSIR